MVHQRIYNLFSNQARQNLKSFFSHFLIFYFLNEIFDEKPILIIDTLDLLIFNKRRSQILEISNWKAYFYDNSCKLYLRETSNET